jgi:hypothetical protein
MVLEELADAPINALQHGLRLVTALAALGLSLDMRVDEVLRTVHSDRDLRVDLGGIHFLDEWPSLVDRGDDEKPVVRAPPLLSSRLILKKSGNLCKGWVAGRSANFGTCRSRLRTVSGSISRASGSSAVSRPAAASMV